MADLSVGLLLSYLTHLRDEVILQVTVGTPSVVRLPVLVHGGAHALATRLGALQDHLHKLGEGGLAVGGPEPGPQPDVGSQDLVLVSRHDSGNPWIRSSAVK